MDSETRPNGGPERRRAPRSALRLNATIREPGRSRTQVRIIDISTHGCRVNASSAASPNTWVMLSIAGLETQYCRVAWQQHEFMGLEFTNPIAEPVLERLLAGQQLSEATVKELRDIANRTHGIAARQSEAEAEIMAELSRQCAVDAVVEGLRLGDAKGGGRR